jgi:hypothetical protein
MRNDAIVPIQPGASLPAALAPDLMRTAELAREKPFGSPVSHGHSSHLHRFN